MTGTEKSLLFAERDAQWLATEVVRLQPSLNHSVYKKLQLKKLINFAIMGSLLPSFLAAK